MLTEQQQLAVETRNVSIVLSSGAGCGKTHVLTARYLSHLKYDGARVSELVAITFTDRAARQMRDRIRRNMEAEKAASKKEEWTNHLRDLETAPISTIHAFCGNLLRQNAVLLGIDPGFEVLEEVLAASFRAESIRNSLQTLLTEESPTGDDLRQVILLYGWDAVRKALEELLREPDRSAWVRWLSRSPEEIADEFLQKIRPALLPKWVEYILATSPKILRSLHFFHTANCIGPVMSGNIARILRETPNLHTSRNLPQDIEELVALAYVGKEKGKAWPDDDTYERAKDALKDYRESLPAILKVFAEDPVELPEAIRTGQRFLRVTLRLAEGYQQRKQRAGCLDFQDLLVLARDLLRDHEEVRRGLRERFRYVLLDELQDTDPVQMELVEHLCGQGLHHGQLFAVGDHKQSIYRFRGAEVLLFEKLRQSIREDGRLGLTRNFRSQPQILHFVNVLCSQRFPEYEALQPHHPQLHEQPCVEFLWSIPEADLEVREDADDVRQREALNIAAHIAGMLLDPTPRIYDEATHELRPVRAGDFVLLFRSMSNVPIYESALRKYGLDYYLVGGRAFFAQQEIHDLLNLLRTLENPDDGMALAGALRSPFCGLSDEALLIIGQHRRGIWEGLHDPERFSLLPVDQQAHVERSRRFFARWREIKDRRGIAELINEVLHDSGYDAALQFEFLGDRKLANLWKLLEMARSFDRSGYFGLAEFIERLGELVSAQPKEEQAATLPETADLIRIMSIHQSKGLEFPVVILPDLNSATGGNMGPCAVWNRALGCMVRSREEETPFDTAAWQLGECVEKLADWAENLRIFYVACTRARDVLILSAGFRADFPAKDFPDIAHPWLLLLAESFDLRSGAVLRSIPTAEVPRIQVRIQRPQKLPAPDSRKAEETDLPPWSVRSSELPEISWDGVVVSLPALDRLSEQTSDEGLFTAKVRPHTSADLLTETFDTEEDDSSPFRRSLRDRLGAFDDTESGIADRLFRRVLSNWDFAQIAGWREWLRIAAEEIPLLPGSANERRVEEWLKKFADSALRKDLATSSEVLRDQEFLLNWSAALESFSTSLPEPLPVLRGILDLLWRDEVGNWQLALIVTRKGGIDPRSLATVQAWVCEMSLGLAPEKVSLWFVDKANRTLLEGKKLRYSAAFATLLKVWKGWKREG